MRPMDLARLQQFYYVAKGGNLTKAAGYLNISPPSLSRSIKYFEYSLKTRLFERASTGMKLTIEGEKLYTYAMHIIQEAEFLKDKLLGNEDAMEGELRLGAQPFCASEWVIFNLNGFLELYPKLKVRIDIDSENVNPTYSDVCLSPFMQLQPHLIQKPLFTLRTKLYASKEYLEKWGTPQKPEDLDHHRLITYKGMDYSPPFGNLSWMLYLGVKSGDMPRTSYLEVSSLHGMMNSALQGYGIAELPDYSFVTNSGLIEILPEEIGPEVTICYIYPRTKQSFKKINKLYEYLSQKQK